MKKMVHVGTSIIFIVIFVFYENSLAWNNTVTHKDLSEYAAESSILRSCKDEQDQNCNYLKDLGFSKGLLEPLEWNGNTTIKKGLIVEWLREGADLEDAGSDWDAINGRARYVNHFHNPTKPWNVAGLSDLQNGESSLLWAQDSTKQSVAIGGDWTWQAIRNFYYNALTKTTAAERQAYFAQTFSGLGHQMHFIQDSSQPAHVRNDALKECKIWIITKIVADEVSFPRRRESRNIFNKHWIPGQARNDDHEALLSYVLVKYVDKGLI